jgi:hypothetical protein
VKAHTQSIHSHSLDHSLTHTTHTRTCLPVFVATDPEFCVLGEVFSNHMVNRQMQRDVALSALLGDLHHLLGA